jgi:hypothetical protein
MPKQLFSVRQNTDARAIVGIGDTHFGVGAIHKTQAGSTKSKEN